MSDRSALELSYQIPPSCPGLAFANDGISPNAATELRKDWEAADDCTLVESDGLRPAHATCATLRVRVPASRHTLDRVYPWAFPFDRGLYLHTMSYAVTGACGPVNWHFKAPGGAVVADGKVTAVTAERSAVEGGDYMPVVLLKEALGTERLHIDSAFTEQGKVFVNETLATVEHELRTMLPDVPFTMPYTLATVAPDGETGGDVANLTVMRLHLPAAPTPELRVRMSGFLAHEMAHLTQPPARNWNDLQKMDDALRAEGGAEFLRWAVTGRRSWTQVAELRRDLERAVNSCVLTAAGGSWNDIPNRGRGSAPYDCGLTFHAVGLAGGRSTASPLLRLRDYYRTAKLGKPTDFAEAIECGTTHACAPRWLNRLAGSEPVETVLRDYARQDNAIVQPAQWSLSMLDLVRRRYVNRLMQLDCNGKVHVSYRDDFVLVGSGLSCSKLREGMALVRAEGLPLFGDVQGLRASARACAERGYTVLGSNDGKDVVLTCDKSAYVPTQLFSVNIEQAVALTK